MVHLLGKLPSEECQKLLHWVVDGVCGREPPRMADYGNMWTLVEWMELLDSLSSLFRLAVGKKTPDEEVRPSSVLASLADVGSGYGEAVLTVLRARREEIRQALVERTNNVSSSTLQDFDWQIKLALSSDKISFLHTPLLNLHLDVKENGALKPLSVEMNREELQTLISSLEAANKVVLQLK
ncbi:COMM domain-containing protein 8-like isoform X1 [Oncorhynchus masou masou]|uniref:COMM domain-containing protein 8-like isoform X1 n=1 Tax=Oncorhynchus masou masou TaxID=90313 RepID=UPI00318369F1